MAGLMPPSPDDRSPAASPDPLDALFPEVYAELHRVAHQRLRSEASGHTLNTTALVHETYLRLSQQRAEAFGTRAQFFALAARAMRRILQKRAQPGR